MKIIILSFRKIISNFKLDIIWFSKNTITFKQKVRFLFMKYYSIITNKNYINYLETDFYYDNIFTPALLQGYPEEILFLDNKINFKNLNSVLDVGANIGQFSKTISYFFPNIKISSFEPNKEIFNLLSKNSKNIKNWDIYNFGIGNKNEIINFFYVPGKSCQGSVYKENSTLGLLSNDVCESTIEIILLDDNKIKDINIDNYYDLIKIDVEGFEIDVLKGLKNINCKYIYMELSEDRKGGNLKDAEEVITLNYGKTPKILFLSNSSGTTRDVIFEIL